MSTTNSTADEKKSNEVSPPPPPPAPTFEPSKTLENAASFVKSLENDENYIPPMMLKLKKLVKELRKGLGWKGVKVYLGNKNPSVREIERSFRQHMKWDFEENKPLKQSKKEENPQPPKIKDVVFGLTYLKRHFDSVEKDSWKINLDAIPEVDRSRKSSEAKKSKSMAERDVKAKREKDKRKKLKYKVHGSKKGGLPVRVEKRKHGKIVTVIQNVEGDAKKLLKELKNELGTGGSICEQPGNESKKKKRSLKDDTEIVLVQVEIQGDHLKDITSFLSKKGGLRGVDTSSSKASRALGSKDKDGKSLKKDKDVKLDSKKKLPSDMPDLSKPLDNKDVKGMKPAILKLILKARGLSIQGSKKELIKRVIDSNS